MSLHIITGGSGSGKSHWLYTHIIEESMKHPDVNYLVLVPEQYTMATQRKLVGLHPAHAIMNIDIASFQRLAIRVFEELGMETLTILDDTGKNLIVRKVMESHRRELTAFAKNLDKAGFAQELKSIISELLQYAITPAQLGEITRLDGLKEALVRKLKDVLVVYDAFMEYIKKDYITAEETLQVLAGCAGRSRLLANSVLVLDGYTGFTPVQYNLMEELFGRVLDVYVTVTIDADEKLGVYRGDEQLFAMSQETVHKLFAICDRQHIQVAPYVVMDRAVRFGNRADLGFLEENVFRHNGRRYNGQPENVRVLSAANPKAEIQAVAGQILDLTRNRGFRYKDIGVVSASMEDYADLASNIFAQNGIPVFVDYKRSVMGNPLVEYIRSGLLVIENSFSYESMFRFLRSGIGAIDREDVDVLENYCLEHGIRSKGRWFKEWEKATGGVNDMRLAVLAVLEPLVAGFGAAKGGRVVVGEMLRSLYAFVVNVNAEGRLHTIADELEQQGDIDGALEYRQVYGKVMGLLDKIYGLLGTEEVSRREFIQILDAGLEEIKLGLIPPTADCVMVGDIERTRLDDIKVLFFVGVNDGIVPKRAENKGILSELDRLALAQNDVVLAPDVRKKTLTQRFYLYLNITKPSHMLVMSYSANGMDGKSLRPSGILHDIGRLFPMMVVEAEDRVESMWLTIPRALVQSWQPAREDRLDEGLALGMYGSVIRESVTRLEGFAACEFSHFVKYGLELKERNQYQIEARDTGSLIHKALEQISRRLEKMGVRYSDLGDEAREELVNQVIEENADSYGDEIFRSSKRSEYMIEQMKRLTGRTVWAIGRQLDGERFEPEDFELRFSIPLEVSDRRCEVSLEGIIDRVDVCEDGDNVYVKIVDYKTGSSTFELGKNYEGIKLQLMTYMRAALELEKKRHPGKNIIPAGAFFYNVDDPIVDVTSATEDVEKKILKELSYDGLANAEMPEEVLGNGMDGVRKNKRITGQQFGDLSDHMMGVMSRMSDDMTQGSIKTNPYSQGQYNSCGYCAYRAICGFYGDVPGNEFRRLKKLSDEEVWAALEAEKAARKQ
jgi:ATP-dependent helicase/nuclease subunit B